MGAMEDTRTEIHQVGDQMVHLVCRQITDDEEYLGLIEGGGVCLANSFSSMDEANAWANSMFAKVFDSHRCDLGCIRYPGAEFLASDETLEKLAGAAHLTDPRAY